MAYAAVAAGVRTPRLLATTEVGTDAAVLAYEHVGGTPLSEIPDEEISDDLQRRIWTEVQRLQAPRLAHRRLVAESILVEGYGGARGAHRPGVPAVSEGLRPGAPEGAGAVNAVNGDGSALSVSGPVASARDAGDAGDAEGPPDGSRVCLVDLRAGEIAAGDLLLLIDIAQLLTELALRVGPERAVRAAADVLGPDTLAAAVPLLQSIALARTTRAGLRKNKDLLSRIREQILALRPATERTPEQPVRLERFRPRTLISIIAGAFGAYVLLSQLSHVNLGSTLAAANWWWTAIALVAAVVSYVAAAFMLRGFVPERLPLGRTVMAQLAGSFVKLVAPAAVGLVAINTRFLMRAGVPSGLAVTSVGASQLTGLAFHILLLFGFGYITGTASRESSLPTRPLIAGLLIAAVLVLVVVVVPPLRRFVAKRLTSMFSGVVPRLLDVLQSPAKIAEGFGGTLLLTVAFVICLDACVRAFGGDPDFAAVAVVFLTGNALGSAAPTPGGLGAVEFALVGGLQLAGVSPGVATSAVLLYRLLTFWLPVLPGWACFTWLQRREAI
ncbi:UPF0104 family protein [Bailinhaonella thermotolerans]|uniref:UPF0104 family protein n=2 Tax=Bailinhaonella thermotolerans TaxID=1070861 RepID=A0A3A4A4T9_9ACTN|nr:UPF0104 family protein [Bailinhaonella thermotolerans]